MELQVGRDFRFIALSQSPYIADNSTRHSFEYDIHFNHREKCSKLLVYLHFKPLKKYVYYITLKLANQYKLGHVGKVRFVMQ